MIDSSFIRKTMNSKLDNAVKNFSANRRSKIRKSGNDTSVIYEQIRKSDQDIANTADMIKRMVDPNTDSNTKINIALNTYIDGLKRSGDSNAITTNLVRTIRDAYENGTWNQEEVSRFYSLANKMANEQVYSKQIQAKAKPSEFTVRPIEGNSDKISPAVMGEMNTVGADKSDLGSLYDIVREDVDVDRTGLMADDALEALRKEEQLAKRPEQIKELAQKYADNQDVMEDKLETWANKKVDNNMADYMLEAQDYLNNGLANDFDEALAMVKDKYFKENKEKLARKYYPDAYDDDMNIIDPMTRAKKYYALRDEGFSEPINSKRNSSKQYTGRDATDTRHMTQEERRKLEFFGGEQDLNNLREDIDRQNTAKWDAVTRGKLNRLKDEMNPKTLQQIKDYLSYKYAEDPKAIPEDVFLNGRNYVNSALAGYDPMTSIANTRKSVGNNPKFKQELLDILGGDEEVLNRSNRLLNIDQEDVDISREMIGNKVKGLENDTLAEAKQKELYKVLKGLNDKEKMEHYMDKVMVNSPEKSIDATEWGRALPEEKVPVNKKFNTRTRQDYARAGYKEYKSASPEQKQKMKEFAAERNSTRPVRLEEARTRQQKIEENAFDLEDLIKVIKEHPELLQR